MLASPSSFQILLFLCPKYIEPFARFKKEPFANLNKINKSPNLSFHFNLRTVVYWCFTGAFSLYVAVWWSLEFYSMKGCGGVIDC